MSVKSYIKDNISFNCNQNVRYFLRHEPQPVSSLVDIAEDGVKVKVCREKKLNSILKNHDLILNTLPSYFPNAVSPNHRVSFTIFFVFCRWTISLCFDCFSYLIHQQEGLAEESCSFTWRLAQECRIRSKILSCFLLFLEF